MGIHATRLRNAQRNAHLFQVRTLRDRWLRIFSEKNSVSRKALTAIALKSPTIIMVEKGAKNNTAAQQKIMIDLSIMRSMRSLYLIAR